MSAFSALRNRQFRNYFVGQTISMTGNWMQTVALSWFVYRMTNSTSWVGAVPFFTQITAFVVSPLAGVFADSKSRVRILVVTSLAAGVVSIILGIFAQTGIFSPIWFVPVLIGVGVVSAFDMTTRHSLSFDLAGRADLPSALTLNSVSVNGSRVLGPAIAGMLLPFLGEAVCFYLNAVTYIAVIWGLRGVPSKTKTPRAVDTEGFFKKLKEAIEFAWRERLIRNYLILSALATFFAFPYTVMLPAIAKVTLGGDSGTLAILSMFSGLGGILGALWISQIAMRANSARQNRVLMASFLGLGIGLFLLGVAQSMPIAGLACFLIGMFFMSIFPSINNAIQLHVTEELRGRILSFYTMTFLGTAPLGALLQGYLSDIFGPGPVVMVSGTACALLSVGYFFIRR